MNSGNAHHNTVLQTILTDISTMQFYDFYPQKQTFGQQHLNQVFLKGPFQLTKQQGHSVLVLSWLNDDSF